MLRVMTFNMNGIRSCARKGFFEWFLAQNIDVLCVQETKAQMAVLTDKVLRPLGYYAYFSDAQKKGYSGVGIYTRGEPGHVQDQLGWEPMDAEGRYIQADFPNFSVVSLYLPSGTSGDVRQAIKMEVLERFYQETLLQWMDSGRRYLLCGDLNIAHRKIDLCNWRANQKHSGFLPEERAWLDRVFDKMGWVDAFRVSNPHPDQYTWWSFRGQARAKNVGWRIDYQVVTPNVLPHIAEVEIVREPYFSDHAPLIVCYDGLDWV